MNLKELNSFKLSDAVTFHDKLNPKLWNGTKLRPDVREQLLVIAQDFLQELGVHDLDVKDITISGSNAAFSYTKHSDLDLHILVDMGNLPVDEVYRELFTAKKTIYNDTHDIKINNIPVELYVQDSRQPVISLGEYSVMNDEWIKIPTKRRSDFDQTATKSKYEKLLSLIEIALQSKKYSKVKHIIDTIKRYRQAGLDKGGEFGPENLAYKMLRSQGYITKLYELRDKLHSEKLSFETMYRNVTDEDYDPNGIPPGPETKPTMPRGTVRVDVSDVYDWYKLGQNISNLDRVDPKIFGKGPPSTIVSFGDEDTEHKYINALKNLGLSTTDIDPIDKNQPKGMPRQKVDPTYNVNEEEEEKNHWYDAGVRDAIRGAKPNPRTYLPTLKDKQAKHPEEVYFYMNGYKSVKQDVNEAFDQPYPLKWETSEYGDVDALARLPDGKYLSIMFNQQQDNDGEEITQVEFYRNNSQEVTGEGDAQRIFATVLTAIQKYIKKYKPLRLTFSASKEIDMDADYVDAKFNPESRAKLYDRLVQRYARAWGYRAFRADNGNIVIYELSRIQQGVKEELEHIPSIGINVRNDGDIDYASLIVDGKKKYESRKTDSLRPYVGKTVAIVRTGSGVATAIGQVTIGEPIVVNAEKFDKLRKQHLVPQGSKFDIAIDGTKYLYPMINPKRWDNEKVVQHKGIVARKIQEQGVAEDETLEFASEKTPPVSPYAGVKDNQYRDGISEAADKKISFKVQKGKGKFSTTLTVNNSPAGIYQYDSNTGRSIAEVYPEFKGKGLGKLLVLHAIYTAAQLGLDFQEDESRTAAYDNVLDSLSSNGYIVDDDGYWYVTGEGEQYLKQSLNEASGYIPSEKEKNDPRFKTALTVDINPYTMKKGAKQFGWNISRAGIPPTAKANGKV